MVLFYDPSEERFAQFEEILKGYDIDAIHAPSLKRAASLLRQRAESFGAVYLHELLNDSSAIEWNKSFESLPEGSKPTVLIGTTSMNPKNIPGIKYIKRPYGLGVFVENIEACFERVTELNEQEVQAGYAGINVTFQAPAQLLGIDEVGAVIQVKFPVVSGSKINVPHELISKISGEDTPFQVTKVLKVQGESSLWQLRISMTSADESRAKRFEKIEKTLSEQLGDQNGAGLPVAG